MTTYSIFKGKQHYHKQASLDIQFCGTKDDSDFVVEIVLNDRVLVSQALVTTPTRLIHLFSDDPDEYELQIVVKGAPRGDMLHIQHIRIEGLNMRNTMEDSGTCMMNNTAHIPSEYMGLPGYQSLKFTTPIYPWLLANERKPTYYL